MYGLPLDTDLRFLVGSVLTQVCIGENEVLLNFEPETSIMVAASARTVSETAGVEVHEDAPGLGRRAVDRLGDSVVDYGVLVGGVLELRFASGSTIELFDTWPNYESYTITHQDTVIVV